MKRRYIITLVCFLVAVLNQGCDNSKRKTSSDIEDYYSEDDGYEDGTYCADVNYYNPNTGTRSTYSLEVEIESNSLVKIYWGNGGWLDEDHFRSADLDNGGFCSFTSDKGYRYRVQITGKNCGGTDQRRFQSDVEEDQEAITCPKCGDEKSEYDDYCYSCQRKIDDEEENTCSRCGGYEYGVYGGLCSSCKRREEEDW